MKFHKVSMKLYPEKSCQYKATGLILVENFSGTKYYVF
ncbi:hypothetical protein NSP_52970 [Nodularia spumigena CCY9414]|nr:hypothetical protein NSP_52970 [Nodularia spumigena CCY9414]